MYQYRVIPAPTKGQKAKGVKTADDRFAFAMSELLNEMAAEGWEYQRAETLPSEERKGLTGKTTTFRNMLVFRRTRQWDHQGDDLDQTQEAQANDVPDDAAHAPVAPVAPAVDEGGQDEKA